MHKNQVYYVVYLKPLQDPQFKIKALYFKGHFRGSNIINHLTDCPMCNNPNYLLCSLIEAVLCLYKMTT